jgi:hypothetical protein
VDSLELTDASYIESPFGNPLCELTCFLGGRLSPKVLSQIGKAQ